MAAVRQVIRGAAHVWPDAKSILDAADRALRSEQPGRIVTAFVGILDPLTLELSYASAGHPRPLVRSSDGTVVELPTSDLPLGLRDEIDPGPSAAVVLPERGLLVLYTDGLTESTRDVLEGEAHLRAALVRRDVAEAEHPAQALRAALGGTIVDDVAVLTVQVTADDRALEHWSFDSHDPLRASATRREVVALLRTVGVPDARTADAELILGELIGNVVRHTGGPVEVTLDLTGASPVLHVLDRGPGFTYYARLPKDMLSESGRGLYIASVLARDVSVIPRHDGGSHARVVLAGPSGGHARS